MRIKITETNALTHNVWIWHADIPEARSIGEAFWLWHCDDCYDCVYGESVGTEDIYGTDKWLKTLDLWCIGWCHADEYYNMVGGEDEDWIINVEEE